MVLVLRYLSGEDLWIGSGFMCWIDMVMSFVWYKLLGSLLSGDFVGLFSC